MFQGLICLRNLKQTMKHGGRRELPDVTEIAAIISGKYTKIQKLYLPGERTKSIKINAVTVRMELREGEVHVCICVRAFSFISL